ncbi:GntR family transcriptional regulator [Gluconacetobacter entanii]|uniref:GntR family transcriptional regulator n=1 Tax=Gluconacetobacter entanii TaxID=108528 RepID=UPI0021BC0FAC|nr:GntR family transcriptional regulator [Gluconacetobacter entanii]MCW4579156.1 GntR family transcriptional regulator [Gluconacetobacter entanii]MCW4582546.1 GntR family transcriptional regulator [Gluconacetobacter entanii]MCW4585944.1 GntR family transcriptional regulator [Gluconacetobacter entanii]
MKPRATGNFMLNSVTPHTGEELYAILRRDMIDSRAKGGTVLQEQKIAEQYGVSRTPVREALQRLHQDNLIGRKGRFYVITSPSHEQILEIYEFREAIEASSVVLCCQRATAAEITAIEHHLETQFRAAEQGHFYEFERLDTLFHAAIADGSHNRLLRHQLEISYDQIWFSRVGNLVSLPDYSVEATLSSHQRIMSAIQRRDVDVARAEMNSHLRSAIELSQRACASRRRLPRGRKGATPS